MSAVSSLNVQEVSGQQLHGGDRKLDAGKLPPSSFEMMLTPPAFSPSPSAIKNSTGFMGDILFSVSNTFEASISLRRCMFAMGSPPELIVPFFRIFVRLSLSAFSQSSHQQQTTRRCLLPSAPVALSDGRVPIALKKRTRFDRRGAPQAILIRFRARLQLHLRPAPLRLNR